jgi:hypothetical protein
MQYKGYKIVAACRVLKFFKIDKGYNEEEDSIWDFVGDQDTTINYEDGEGDMWFEAVDKNNWAVYNAESVEDLKRMIDEESTK